MADWDRQGLSGAFTAQGLIDEPGVSGDTVVPEPLPSHPIVVPGVDQHLNRWRFIGVVAGVWIVAAMAGLGLYYWWYHSLDKTMPVFVVLVYLISCIVGSLLSALVHSRPVISATAIALMSAPFASTAAAAVLYGGYVFGWISR